MKIPAQSPNIHTVNLACGSTVSIINLVFGLTYFDLTENEHSVSMNKDLQISIFIEDPFIPSFSRSIIMTALSHERIMSSEGSAESIINIWMDVNSDSLDYYSAMLQNHINWNPAMQAEVKLQIKNKMFEMTFLPSEKTAIGCRWMFKHKKEAVLIIDLANDNNQNQAARRRREREQMKIQTCYKAYLVVKGFEQQYKVDF